MDFLLVNIGDLIGAIRCVIVILQIDGATITFWRVEFGFVHNPVVI